MELHLTAHDILGYISKAKWVMTVNISGENVYQPIAFEEFSLEHLCKVLPQYQIEELKYAIDHLSTNKHLVKLNAEDWLQIRVKCLEDGEKAYEQKHYIYLHEKSKIESSEQWRKKNWFLIAVFAFVVGSVIAPITVEWLKRCLWPDTTQQHKSTSKQADTILKR